MAVSESPKFAVGVQISLSLPQGYALEAQVDEPLSSKQVVAGSNPAERSKMRA